MTDRGEFGKEEVIDTPSGGCAVYFSNKYEVSSRMWSCGGGSIVGHAWSQACLDRLLAIAEERSLASKTRASTNGAARPSVPLGCAVTSMGDVVLDADWDEVEDGT